ncbi:MAG: amidohydrolase [Gemmatimonadetes bacterium]|nr:amidohydrolase [Gemmatimonadota bacterium]
MADLIMIGGTVWTAVEALPLAEAVAVQNGRVIAVGTNQEIQDLMHSRTRVIELNGRTVTPGFIDAHMHFISGGFQLSGLDLREATTPEEFVIKIKEFAESVPSGTWITGGNWDHELWGGLLPRNDWIDPFTQAHPVLVQRLDGHMALANSLALKMSGVATKTGDPPGGSIVRDEAGLPSGVLKDQAIALVREVIPPTTVEATKRALQSAAQHTLSCGITQVHDMGGWNNLDMMGWANLEVYHQAHSEGHLPLRVYSVVPMSSWRRMKDYVSTNGRGDDRLWWGGVKAFVDGSLGSATAWFHEAYLGESGNTGLTTTDTAELQGWIEGADKAGLQPIVHAIGDRANDWLLDIYEDLVANHGTRDRRLRVEHAQHLSQSAVGRFSKQGVIASMQPYHAVDDGRWAAKRIGPERIKHAYAFRSLLDTGATLAFGSDWTVAPLDPMLGIDAAVTRRTLDRANPDGWMPEERISLEQALLAYTAGAAKAGFSEDRSGSLENGKLADLVVLSENLFEIHSSDIRNVEVDMTLVDGEVVYDR